ncbi:uncharacterized protein [Triticum aestivum]|uniref:uncharacterized protein isoform X2 n=1 Tax=Triticum aestivum TaxID=4565 RepID=UPI001D00FD12|nr:uncharacterized protein LOC123122157 isoform X2 [Triticum aestivum]
MVRRRLQMALGYDHLPCSMHHRWRLKVVTGRSSTHLLWWILTRQVQANRNTGNICIGLECSPLKKGGGCFFSIHQQLRNSCSVCYWVGDRHPRGNRCTFWEHGRQFMHQDGGKILTSETSQHFTILDHRLLHYSSTAKRRVVLVAEGSKDQAEGWMQEGSRTRQHHFQKLYSPPKKGGPGTVVESLHLWPGGPGFKPASLQNYYARVRLSRNSLPQTPPCVGAFSTGYTLFI